jgi:DNA-binding transcriptional LysR family regulator
MEKLDFNLTHLRYFFDAALAESVKFSAEKNYVTHSTVSQGIKRLEQALGVALLAHQKRTFVLTNEGRYLLTACERIFRSLEFLQNEIQVTHSEPAGELLFASSGSISSAFLLPCFPTLQEKFPRLKLRLKVGTTPFICESVLNRRAEFGITLDDGHLENLESIDLFEGQFICVSRRPLAKFEDIQQVVLTGERPETKALKKLYTKKFHSELPVENEIDSWELVLQLAQDSNMVGFVPDFVVRKKRTNLHLIKLPSPIHYRLVLVHRRNERLSRNAEAFLNSLHPLLRSEDN